MKWLFKPKKHFILDVGSHTIKLAEFSLDKKKTPFLENFDFLPVPEGCMEQGDLINPGPLQDVLPEFISRNVKETIPNLYVSVGGRSVIVKKIEIYRSEKELIDDLVREEMIQVLPFNIDEINYDYMPMTTSLSTSENKTNFLVIISKSDNINKINRLIDDVGYKCAAIDMGSFALSECVKFMDSDFAKKGKNILILDIGKSGTAFIVLNQGNLIFSRYMLAGSNFYTANIMKEMGVEYQEAESLKVSWCSGSEVPAEMDQIIKESDRYFCDEIFVGKEYFKNQFPNEELSQAYLTGGGSKVRGLISSIEEKFNIPTSVLDPFEKLKASEFLEDSLSHIKHFAPLLIGSCIRGFSE
ncbi:MAG: type IV pilus assembly protein PilM [Bdellovibrionales bacterium]|nr:type IV pilus assembly protein PilM [Bdellovibrionales bacterium]